MHVRHGEGIPPKLIYSEEKYTHHSQLQWNVLATRGANTHSFNSFPAEDR